MSHFIGDLFLIASAFLFISAYKAFNINRKLHLNKTLTILCLFMGVGCFMNAIQFYSKSQEMCMLFSRLSRIGWCFYAPVAFHFGLYLSNVITKIKNRSLIYLAYLPGIFFFIVNFTDHLRISGFAQSTISDYLTPIYSYNIIDFTFLFYQYSLVIITLIFIFMAQFTGKSKRLRKQAIIIISTSFIALVFDILHYALSKNGQFSWMWGFELIIFSVGLFISISYLKFTLPAPNLVSDYILDKINEMIFVIDTEGIIIESNFAMNKMLNKSAKDIMGNHLDEYLPYVFISIRDLKELNDLEINITTSDNSIVPIRVNSTRIIDRHNDYIGNVLVCTNLSSTKILQEEISERKRIEDELIKADRAKDEFLSLVSHELLSPLSAIFLWVDLAKNDKSLQTKALDIIAENAQKQFLLVDELLLFTRLQNGKIILNITEIEIIQIINDIINKIENNKDSTCPKIIINKGVSAIQALVDVDRFNHIIRLLICNSIAFATEINPITLNVIKTGNYIKILITDHRKINNDIDIDIDIDKIFNPLRDDVVNSGIDLNELHLAVARSLTELHGGYLNARNNDTHDGLTFELLFPILK